MLVYVAVQVLGFLVFGPWKDPNGYNFPQTQMFEAATKIPRLFASSRMHIGVLIAVVGAGLVWVFLFRTRAGFAQQVGGIAPAAARYAGFSSRSALWTAMLVSGGFAGLAGALEVAGPIGQLTPYVPAGYGFAAIIVAFVGRLHPGGLILSSLLMSMFYIGGELAQSRLGLPKSLTGVFQGLLLFSLLACDTLILVTGRVPDDRLYHELSAAPRGFTLNRVGDCLQPSSIADAVYSAHRFAREFGEEPVAVPRRERPPVKDVAGKDWA
jgi:simple sugar transport system permease protein